MRLDGYFFRPLSSKKEEGEIELSNRSASVICDDETVCSEVAIQSIQSRKDIFLENGYLFTLKEVLTSQQENQLLHKVSMRIEWPEKFSIFKAIILSLVLLSAIFAFRYTLTAMTPLAVAIFPHEWEQAIGANTYEALQKTVLGETELPSGRLERIRSKASHLAFENGFESPEVLFHKSDVIGVNALALPGGPIVLTDDLVRLLEKDDLILGVIAHEFAHVQQRHSLYQIIEVIGVAAIASVLLGADDTLIEEASLIGINLWANKTSRGFEKEADLLALKYMKEGNLNKASLERAIRKLLAHFCVSKKTNSLKDCQPDSQRGWLSSHPSGAERLEYLNTDN